MQDYKFNNTHYTGCGCPSGRPPCSWCTDTFTCDCCQNREYSEGAFETPFGFICMECHFEQRTSIIPIGLEPTEALVYMAGHLVGKLTNVRLK